MFCMKIKIMQLRLFNTYSAVKCALFPPSDNVPQNLTVVE